MKLRQIHAYNESIAIGLALVLNSILLYCVLVEKDKLLRAYRTMILMNVFTEFFFIGVNILVRPQFIFYDGQIFCVINAIAQHSPQKTIDALAWLYAFSTAVDCMKSMVDYLVRYWIVCRQMHPSPRRLLASTLAMYLFSFFHNFPLYLSFTSANPLQWNSYFLGSAWAEPDGVVVRFTVAKMTHPATYVYGFFGDMDIMIVYGTIFWCSRRIMAELKSKTASMSAKTLEMQRGLNRMLLGQAIVPFLVSIVPSIVGFASLFVGSCPPVLGLMISMCLCWTACAGPACVLYFVQSYRRRLLSFIPYSRFFPPSSTSSSTTPLPTI